MTMTQNQIDFHERINAETSPTGNEEFDKNGYLVLKNLWDPKDLYCEPPAVKGKYKYFEKIDRFFHDPVEDQVEGSTSRYFYPPYKYAHSQIRMKLEKEIGKKLYNTYYYDRFYNPGQKLSIHTDRDACEISVTIHISSNVSNPWPIWIKTPDTYSDKNKTEILTKGDNRSVILNPGDGMVYKGCERPHWRKSLPIEYENKRKNLFPFFTEKVEKKEIYYHQVFFHYVLADGIRANFAFDRGQE